MSTCSFKLCRVLRSSYVTAGEVAALEHELGDDTVEGRALVAEALLAGAESAEVLGGLGNDVIVQLEVDATRLLCILRLVSTLSPSVAGQEAGQGEM